MDFKDSIVQFTPPLPFIQMLWYDVFNPFEVNPEFIADLGIKNPLRFYTDLVTPNKMDDKPRPFTAITKKAFSLIVSDLINDRLKSALKTETANTEPLTEAQQDEPSGTTDPQIETTQEEIEACLIVKSMLRQKIDPQRIHLRDAQTYCAILLDDNNRKPVCRLSFNGKKKYVEIPDENKKFSKYEIQTLDDIFSLGDKLGEVVKLPLRFGITTFILY